MASPLTTPTEPDATAGAPPDRQAVLRQVCDLVRARRSFLVTTHRAPDGDGIGTGTALANLLAALGKEVVCYDIDPVPYTLRFLPGADRWVQALPPGKSFDATFVVDTGDVARCFPPGAPVPLHRLGVKVLVDHHLTQKPFADVELLDVDAAANGLQVWDLVRALDVALTRDVALGIYVSILADTGNFRYSSTDARALRAAAAMVDAGVDPWEVTVHLHESHPAARWRLLGRVLETLVVSSDGLCASLLVRRAWVEDALAGAGPGQESHLTDGFVNYARAIVGVEVAVELSEADADATRWRASFRSRGSVNVARVAETFGGGGHHNAAGAELSGTLDEVRERVHAAVRAAMQEAGLG
jgi:phosphoesterase RecJ-like protein